MLAAPLVIFQYNTDAKVPPKSIEVNVTSEEEETYKGKLNFFDT